MPRLLLLALLLLSCTRTSELRVFAAASLADALTEVAAASGEKVVFNFGASSTLARQIDAGAPADLFVSADEGWMDWLAERRRIDPATRVAILSNRLAIIGDLRSARSIALADPAAVPAGIYARIYLEQEGLWDELSPRIIPTDNVRAALHAVESGNADAAIVYVTDAATSRTVRITTVVEDGPPISYPAAVVHGAEQPDAAKRFLAALRSEAAAAIFRRHGFIVRS
ncbi:MAG TPA: molybdate ABC transporter substrate-binding protein [Thermoanaerobaculia bacterium]|nr:molybdate ABC transporter substrate-binding protein [Thermoanaerobaculia bacterium]